MIERDSVMDMDLSIRWDILLNMLNEIILVLRRIEKRQLLENPVDEDLAAGGEP